MMMYINSIKVYVCEKKIFFVGLSKDKLKYRLLIIRYNYNDAEKEIKFEEINEWTDIEKLKENLNKFKQHITSPVEFSFKIKALIGFVKFFKCYYVVYVDSKKVVANIGYHQIYTILQSKIIILDALFVTKFGLSFDEKIYLRLMNDFDLSQNFYYSPTYDLKHTVQFNSGTNGEHFNEYSSKFSSCSHYRNHCCKKYIWNFYHTKPMRKANISNFWYVDLLHGFIAQNRVDINGRRFFITLIARRSRKYAGTRYLKRGSNDRGYAANEVETEQIFHEHCSLFQLKLSSYTQMRGSVPFNWSQTTNQSSITPKPPIVVSIHDPYYTSAGKHFKQLLSQYGSPIVCLNLVKAAERSIREGILTQGLEGMTKYLNQFITPQHQIQYIPFDMARIKKRINKFALIDLIKLSKKLVKRTGFFLNDNFSAVLGSQIKNISKKISTTQHGVIRLNCVDCLDRTNVAQFLVGYNALIFQMADFGLVSDYSLKIDNPIVAILEELYDAHGDTLALQYGGSMTAHRINTYIKSAPWSDVSRDLMQNVSRYLNNAFQDHEKQQVINLFLGVYRPYEMVTRTSIPLWEMVSDYNIHCSQLKYIYRYHPLESLTLWFPLELYRFLPYARVKSSCQEKSFDSSSPNSKDVFDLYYQPQKYKSLVSLFVFGIPTVNFTYRTDLNLTRQASSLSQPPTPKSSGSLLNLSINSKMFPLTHARPQHIISRTSVEEFDGVDENDLKLYRQYLNEDHMKELLLSFNPDVYKAQLAPSDRKQLESYFTTSTISPVDDADIEIYKNAIDGWRNSPTQENLDFYQNYLSLK